jgi:hypothetical protein
MRKGINSDHYETPFDRPDAIARFIHVAAQGAETWQATLHPNPSLNQSPEFTKFRIFTAFSKWSSSCVLIHHSAASIKRSGSSFLLAKNA